MVKNKVMSMTSKSGMLRNLRMAFMVLFIFEKVRHQESIGNCMGGSMNLFRKSVKLTEVGRIPDFVINQAIQFEKRILSIQQMPECCVICGSALHGYG